MQLLSFLILFPFALATSSYSTNSHFGQSPKANACVHSIDDQSAQVSFDLPLLPPVEYWYEVRTSGLPGSGENGLVHSGKSLINDVAISGLIPGMLYTVYFKYSYPDTEMPWIYGSSFNTSVCPSSSKVELQFQLLDKKGDGWNGTILGIKQAGIDVGELYLAEGSSNTGFISICSEEITEIYVKHLGENSEDISLVISQQDSNFKTIIQQNTAFSNNQVLLSHLFTDLQTQR